MINQKAQAEIEDINGKDPLVFEVNFDEEHKDCVKITIKTDDHGQYERIVKYSDLFSFMFTLGTKEQQAKMIPVREELGTEYMKTLRIRCTKDMKAGEEIVVHTKIHVPTIIEESIKKE